MPADPFHNTLRPALCRPQLFTSRIRTGPQAEPDR